MKKKKEHKHRWVEVQMKNKKLHEGGAAWFRCACKRTLCVPGNDR